MHKLWLILFVGSILTACGGAGGRSSPDQLTIAINSGVEGDGLKTAKADYEREFSISITIAEFPYTNLFEKEFIDLKEGTGAYDIIMLDDPWFPRFAEEDLLAEFEPLYQKRGLSGPDDDFVTASLALCYHPYGDGKLYALPYVGNSQMFFYREDLFHKHNLPPPETWDDVLSSARLLQEKEGIFGYVMRGAQGNPIVADYMPLFWAFGGEMFDSQGNPQVNSPEGVEALRFMIELGKYSPPGYVSFNADEVGAHLSQGTAAMGINWPAWISTFDDPTKSKVVGKIGYLPIPSQKARGASSIGNWLLAIPKSARNQEKAFDFILWATSKEQMKLSALRGNPPTRVSVFKDPELLARFKAYPVQLVALESSKPRPRTPLWNEIENVFGIYLSQANSKQLSPEEALGRANDEIKRIIERNRRAP